MLSADGCTIGPFFGGGKHVAVRACAEVYHAIAWGHLILPGGRLTSFCVWAVCAYLCVLPGSRRNSPLPFRVSCSVSTTPYRPKKARNGSSWISANRNVYNSSQIGAERIPPLRRVRSAECASACGLRPVHRAATVPACRVGVRQGLDGRIESRLPRRGYETNDLTDHTRTTGYATG